MAVLSAEMFAKVPGFDVCSTIRLALNDLFAKKILFKIYNDSFSMFDCLTNINGTT